MGFITKRLRFLYETVKDPYFPTKPCYKLRSERKDFQAKSSSHVSREEPLKVWQN